MLLDWKQISQTYLTYHRPAYVTLMAGASLGGANASCCRLVVDENFLLPRAELYGWMR